MRFKEGEKQQNVTKKPELTPNYLNYAILPVRKARQKPHIQTGSLCKRQLSKCLLQFVHLKVFIRSDIICYNNYLLCSIEDLSWRNILWSLISFVHCNTHSAQSKWFRVVGRMAWLVGILPWTLHGRGVLGMLPDPRNILKISTSK